MKILLIKPPVRDFYQTSIRTQPIGLAYLAASLISGGYEAEILDCQAGKKKSLAVPPELSYLCEYYPSRDKSPFRLYSGYYHFGLGLDEISRKIKDSKANVFGISSSFTPYHGEALEIAGIIKDLWPDKIVVMGGPHVSCDPESVLKDPCVDYVVIGEGEIRFPLLLEKIFNNKKDEIKEIDGIGFRENGKIYINHVLTFLQDPDIPPFPARELLDPDKYRIMKKRAAMIITSRGCPHRCAYCSSHLVMGNIFRARSPEAVVGEMKECLTRFGIQSFDFEDDNFTFDQDRAKRLLTLIIGTFGEGKLELSAMNGVSFASLDKELLGLMKRAGFSAVNLSFVSSDIAIKQNMNRPDSITGFDGVVEAANQAGLHVTAYAIIGMPGQTIEEMTDTLIYLMERRVLIGPSVYYPTPGTSLFERCRREGLLPRFQSQWRSSAFPIETKQFNRLDLVTLFRLTRAINYVKGQIDEESEGITWGRMLQSLREELDGKSERDLSYNDKETLWKFLLLFSVKQRSFFSSSEAKGKNAGIEIAKEKTSQKVMDCFLDKARDRPVRRTRGGF